MASKPILASDMGRDTKLYSPTQLMRLKYKPVLPSALTGQYELKRGAPTSAMDNVEDIKCLFPNCFGQAGIDFVPVSGRGAPSKPLKIGVVLSGGQAPGGHNVISGLYDFLKKQHPKSELIGFLDGPRGVFTGKYMVITAEYMDCFRNQGGFDMICSGRDKIESDKQKTMALKVCTDLGLDGLVVIGGDDSNTNAAILGEFFQAKGGNTVVVGVPKTIDGDLKTKDVETSFGFDTAAKLFAELTGNIMFDCVSSKKYYHFIRLMGREAAHITLEVAMQTRPNMAFIGEEIRAHKTGLSELTKQVADLICERHQQGGKNYGVILIPEGLVEFVPEMRALIACLNDLAAKGVKEEEAVKNALPADQAKLFTFIPTAIRRQLLKDRDPHGNVNVSAIETEKFVIGLVEAELKRRRQAGQYKGKFKAQTHFFGYEGRAGLPSTFDSNYCYALGTTAGALVQGKANGMMAICRGLAGPVASWRPGGLPITALMNMEKRKGKQKPVIRKALVDLDSSVFKTFCQLRVGWRLTDDFRNPGPIQFTGPTADDTNYNLRGGAEPPGNELTGAGSRLQCLRRRWQPTFPLALRNGAAGVRVRDEPGHHYGIDEDKQKMFPFSSALNPVEVMNVPNAPKQDMEPIKMGVVFCGRQCPGAHNILLGLLHFLKSVHPSSTLIGFRNGPVGFLKQQAIVLTEEYLGRFRNQGGLESLGRSQDKLRTPEEQEGAMKVCQAQGLTGLCLVGGSTTHGDAAMLAEYFFKKQCSTRVVTIPGNVYGVFRNKLMECPVGFDTAARTYANLVGNIATDCNSAKKYWFFIRVMGEKHSRLALEVALQTQPQVVLLMEEVIKSRTSLHELVVQICDVVEARAARGKDYGLVLMPEGLVSAIPEIYQITQEINALMARGVSKAEEVEAQLSPWSTVFFSKLPQYFREQLLLPRSSFGELPASQCEIERLMQDLCAQEIALRKKQGSFKGKFSAIGHFLGYQARAAMPSLLDCRLSYALGGTAAALVACGKTAMMANARLLTREHEHWYVGGIPLPMTVTVRASLYGTPEKVMIEALKLRSKAIRLLAHKRQEWAMGDSRGNIGPIQYDDTVAVAHLRPMILMIEQEEYARKLDEVSKHVQHVADMLRPGCDEAVLDAAVNQLTSIDSLLTIINQELIQSKL